MTCKSDQLLAQDGRYQHAVRQTADARVGRGENGALSWSARRSNPLGFWALFIAGGAVGTAVALVLVLCS